MNDEGSLPRSPRGVDRIARRLGELDAREMRLLAHGVGDHLPHEISVNVDQLRYERALLLNPIGHPQL